MSEKYKTYPNGTFFVTLTVVGWIDVFTRADYGELIVDSLNHCIERKGLKVYAWVLMSNHLHLVAQSETNLSFILRDFKSYTAKEIMKAISENPKESRKEWLLYMFNYFANIHGGNRDNQFWQDGSHPISLDDHPGWFSQKVNYIHLNPVRSRIVDEPQHYPWSSAYPLNRVKSELW
jgi:putative transposase